MIVNAAALAALFTTLKTEFDRGLESAAAYWDRVATPVPSASAQNTYAWLGKFPKLREWIGDKAVQNLKQHTYTLVNKDYEATVGVDRNDIEDDNLGVYKPMAQMAGYGAKTWPDENLFPLLKGGWSAKCYDGKPFFSDAHKVGKASFSNDGGGEGAPWFLMDASKPLKPLIYQQRKLPQFLSLDDPESSDHVFKTREFLYGVEARGNFGFGLWQLCYGSKQTLDGDAYAAARAAMMTYMDEHARPLNVMPNLLVVPPSLEAKARKVLKAELIDGGDTNVWAGTAEPIVVPWLA